MALVPYTGDFSNTTANDTSKKETTITTKYKGLSNQGATCYMNSSLQTLYMTPEFRLLMYSWNFDEKIHGKTSCSIPYQLQKLFAKLQVGAKSYVETRSLTKSFDWDIKQLTEQQDIQEFYQALFDAIEISDVEKKLNVTQIYEGFVFDSIKCSKCGGGSKRKDRFVNITLPINDPFTKTCNKSLEMALENYLKPEILTGTNAYSCEKCATKVDAAKGIQFAKLPLILAFQLNRFAMNWTTGIRTKINDRVTFPFILNMNNYINGYEGIKKKANQCEKELEEELKLFGISIVEPPAPISAATISKIEDILPAPLAAPEPTEKIVEPLGKEENIEGVSGVDLTEKERNNPYLWQTKPKSRRLIDEEETLKIPDINEYSVKYSGEKFDIQGTATGLGITQKTDPKTEKSQEAKEIEEAIKKIAQMENEEKIKAVRKRQIESYTKEGPDVYELYSVVVHVGGAFGGHYYVYIKSFEDDKWYCFNDSTITVSCESDVIKTFGEKEGSKCAYMLMYRRYGVSPPKITPENLPKYLQEEIEKERIEEEKEEAKRREAARRLNITVFYANNVNMFCMYKDDTLKKLKENIISHFKIETTLQNCRLRTYVRERKVMLDAYLPERDNETLDQIGISSFRDYTVELKGEKDKFVEFTDDDMYVRIVNFSPEYKTLEEEYLPVINIPLKKSSKLKDLISKIAAELKVKPVPEELRVFKKKLGQAYSETQFVPIIFEDNMEKCIRDLFIYDNSFLFTETIKNDDDAKRSRWIKMLEDDKAKLHILFNNPYQTSSNDYCATYENELIVNKNITLDELKKQMSEKLKIPIDEFVLRRTGKEGPELKEMSNTLGSLGLIRQSNIYVEFGKPCRPDEYKLIMAEAVQCASETDDTQIHELMDWGEFPIMSTSTVFQVKSMISERLKSERSWDVPPTRIRLRERCSDKLGKVFIDNFDMQFYQMYDGKNVGFQILDYDEHFTLEDVVIILRVWDTANWTLSEPKEIVIKNTWRMHDLAYKVCDNFPEFRSKIDCIMAGKISSLWNFKRGNLLGLQVFF